MQRLYSTHTRIFVGWAVSLILIVQTFNREALPTNNTPSLTTGFKI